MSIWIYDNQAEGLRKNIVQTDRCIYCAIEMGKLKKGTDFYGENNLDIKVCSQCGWWTVIKSYQEYANSWYGGYSWDKSDGAYASLKQLDLTDIDTPLDEVRNFLKIRFDGRFHVNQRLFEYTVASIFKNQKYIPEVTSYHNDGGIDIILHGEGGDRIGVQVKRTKNSITVEQIRAFTGALLYGKLLKGIFVTTSRYQSGAYKLIEDDLGIGLKIELMDAPRLYDALKLRKTEGYDSQTEFLSDVGDIKLRNFLTGDYAYTP